MFQGRKISTKDGEANVKSHVLYLHARWRATDQARHVRQYFIGPARYPAMLDVWSIWLCQSLGIELEFWFRAIPRPSVGLLCWWTSQDHWTSSRLITTCTEMLPYSLNMLCTSWRMYEDLWQSLRPGTIFPSYTCVLESKRKVIWQISFAISDDTKTRLLASTAFVRRRRKTFG